MKRSNKHLRVHLQNQIKITFTKFHITWQFHEQEVIVFHSLRDLHGINVSVCKLGPYFRYVTFGVYRQSQILILIEIEQKLGEWMIDNFLKNTVLLTVGSRDRHMQASMFKLSGKISIR